MNEKIVTLDVREELRQGREPFSLIMRTVQQLQTGQALRLIAPFEPKPLYGVLGNQGFGHATQATPEGDFEVLFEKQGHAKPTAGPLPTTPPCRVPRNEVDARGLEPPQPMIKILEAVEVLPAGVELRARTDRRPLHLLDQLKLRGFDAQCEEQTDGSYLTHIRRG